MSEVRGRILKRARDYALEHHGDQMYGNNPYYVHLDDVVRTLKEFGYDYLHLLVSGYLHDTIEDTPVETSDIREEFGDVVANIVELVTNKTGEDKKRRTFEAIATDRNAVKVKMADRISNIRQGDEGTRKHYAKQHKHFKNVSDVAPEEMRKEYEKLIGISDQS